MSCCGGSREPRPSGTVAGAAHDDFTDDPPTILKTRLAKGEITIEEYDRLMAVLSRAS